MKLIELKPAFIGVTIASLIALFPLPYGYYTFLRILVCGCSAATAFLALNTSKYRTLGWASIPVGILFNPIIPVHLDRVIWSFFNVAVALFFGYCAFKINENEK